MVHFQVALLRSEDVHVHLALHLELVVDADAGFGGLGLALSFHFLSESVLLLDFCDLLGLLVDLVGANDEGTHSEAADNQQHNDRENDNQTCRACNHRNLGFVTDCDSLLFVNLGGLHGLGSWVVIWIVNDGFSVG